MGSFYWRSPVPALLAAALVLAVGIWLVVLYRRQRAQHSLRRTAALLVPKVMLALLVVLAYFDPVWKVIRDPGEGRKVALLIDNSSSMEVSDAEDTPRAARAARLLDELKARLGSAVMWDTYEFDQQVRPYDEEDVPAGQLRETDLGTCLATMADKPDISKYLGIVLITDGGDEVVQNARLPQAPVYIGGVGSEPEGWDDLAIESLDAPTVVETESTFTVAAEIVIRRGAGDLAPSRTEVQALLEEQTKDGWLVRSAAPIDLGMDRQGVELNVESPVEQGLRDYRLRIDPLQGELSALNNERIFPVEIGRDKLPVLLFAQGVGWDFSTVRKELARDPSLALTTLFRISEDRFVIQDSRQEGDQALTAGFPSDKGILDLYKCVILGSFPASQWQPAQMQALVDYVKGGGAAIFLGGEASYGQGRYDNTVLEPLFPWRLNGAGRELRTGQFAVSVPAAATSHGIVAEMVESLAQAGQARIESLNPVGPPRGGAVTLLETNVGGVAMPVVALQHYGQGYCMAIATDTLWKWTKTSDALSKAFSHFWREAVRNVSQWVEGEQFLSVRWDQPRYRPGERATATINVAGRYEAGQVHVKATLATSGEPEALDVTGVLGSDTEFSASMVVPERGEYTVTVSAFVGEKLLESYEKVLRVRPVVNEGGRLEVDHAFLDYLATQTGGAYFRESDFGRLAETLQDRVVEQAVTIDMPLVQFNYVYVAAMLIVLIVEWIVRRKMNLF